MGNGLALSFGTRQTEDEHEHREGGDAYKR
jgi:hypothetical protein